MSGMKGAACMRAQVDGGAPMDIDGALVICDRSDLLTGRTFDGSVAQLSVYNAALSENNVRGMVPQNLNCQLAWPLQAVDIPCCVEH